MWNVLLTFVCMGTKWMIEMQYQGHPQWWTGKGWSSDCHQGMQFDDEHAAEEYMWESPEVCSSCEGQTITEHMFMSPISTEEKLN